MSHIDSLRTAEADELGSPLCLGSDTLIAANSLLITDNGEKLPFYEGQVILADEAVIVIQKDGQLQAMSNPGSKLLPLGDYRLRDSIISAH